VVNEDGRDLPAGELGELVIAGPGVMRGYFGQPELTAGAFLHDDSGTPWYRTGDLVVDDGNAVPLPRPPRPDGQETRLPDRARRDRVGALPHEGVDRAAVIARADDSGVSIAAFVAMKPAQKGRSSPLKRHCTSYLPHYMIPDSITFLSDLPTTSTDKVDYQGLKRRAGVTTNND